MAWVQPDHELEWQRAATNVGIDSYRRARWLLSLGQNRDIEFLTDEEQQRLRWELAFFLDSSGAPIPVIHDAVRLLQLTAKDAIRALYSEKRKWTFGYKVIGTLELKSGKPVQYSDTATARPRWEWIIAQTWDGLLSQCTCCYTLFIRKKRQIHCSLNCRVKMHRRKKHTANKERERDKPSLT